MKNVISRSCLLLVGSFVCCGAALADETNSAVPILTGPAVNSQTLPVAAPEGTQQPVAASPQQTPTKLPYGVDDVLKLSQAQVHDDVILNYIQSVGTVYNLGPKEIIHLRNEGVSDTIINSMLDQRKKALLSPSPAVTTEASAAEIVETPVYEPAPVVTVPTPVPVAVYPDPVYAEVPVVAPIFVPYEDPSASTLYIIPDASVRAAYYGGGCRSFYGSFGRYRSSVYTIGTGYRAGYSFCHRSFRRR